MSAVEIWKDIPGYEGRYQASDQGRVKALARITVTRRVGEADRLIARGERFLTQYPDRYGYLQVSLRSQPKKVHTLVALTFIGPRSKGADIAHGNGNKVDNRLLNLRYATQAENAQDREAHGRTARGELVATAKLTAEKVAHIRSLRGVHKQIEIAARFGISQTQVSAIQLGKSWSAA